MKDKILNQIEVNKLGNMSYEFIVAQLCVLNNRPFEQIKLILDELIAEKRVKINVLTEEQASMAEQRELSDHKNKMRRLTDSYKSGDKESIKIQGKIQGTKSAFAFLIPADRKFQDVFIPEKFLNGAVNGDTVIVSARAGRGGKKLEGKVVKILERGNEIVVGKIFLSKTNAVVMPDDVKMGRDIWVPLSKIKNATNGYKVVVRIDDFSTKRNPVGHVVEVLGPPNKIETEVMAIIKAHNLKEEFPKKVVDAAEAMPSEIDKSQFVKIRKDLTDLVCFTIDGADSRDLDDAVSISKNQDGTYKLGVHIADVGEYVKFGSILDQEAFKRATSVYFPNLVLPMLPRNLSNGICSLNELVDRLALSCFMDINDKGEVVNYEICESVINSKKRFTYSSVTKILDGDKYERQQNVQFVDDLLMMNELNKILFKSRVKRGAIDFDIPEVKIKLDELGDVVDLCKAPREDSHRLIESFMVVANETVATHYNKIKAPFVYRVHESPDTEKMANFIRVATSFGIKGSFYPDNIKPKDLQNVLEQVSKLDCNYMLNRIMLRSMKKAKYSPECIGHFGLASVKYSHFTSPIRRYPDLTIHRIIKADLRGELIGAKKTEQKQFVLASSMVSSDREVVSEKIEREVDELYKVFYMTHHIDEEFEGKVSGVTNFGVFVELENTVEGLIKISNLPNDNYKYQEENFALVGANNRYVIGDAIKIKCVSVDILSREIDFILV